MTVEQQNDIRVFYRLCQGLMIGVIQSVEDLLHHSVLWERREDPAVEVSEGLDHSVGKRLSPVLRRPVEIDKGASGIKDKLMRNKAFGLSKDLAGQMVDIFFLVLSGSDHQR